MERPRRRFPAGPRRRTTQHPTINIQRRSQMRTSGNGSRGTRFVLGFESLEDRTVPNGNVTVSVLDHVLYVNGDAADNRIWISGFGKDSVIIRSIDGTTTINGKAGQAFFDSVKKGYSINMGDGDDGVAVTDTKGKGGVEILTGNGDDSVALINAGHRGRSEEHT